MKYTAEERKALGQKVLSMMLSKSEFRRNKGLIILSELNRVGYWAVIKALQKYVSTSVKAIPFELESTRTKIYFFGGSLVIMIDTYYTCKYPELTFRSWADSKKPFDCKNHYMSQHKNYYEGVVEMMKEDIAKIKAINVKISQDEINNRDLKYLIKSGMHGQIHKEE